jgi:anti-sigma B factor antagonist
LTELELHQSAALSGNAIRVRGEIDMATAPQLRELLEQMVSSGTRRIVLDCRELEFLDSSGIGVLVAARNRMGDGGELVIESPPPHVLKVLEITGVSEHLSVVADTS